MSTSIWDLYHLSGNPFFQAPLGEDDAHPLAGLFVGRQADLRLAVRMTTHDHATRTVIVGGPGVGKTTFVHRLLLELAEDTDGQTAYVAATPAIRLQRSWRPADFCFELLRMLLILRAGQPVQEAPDAFVRGLTGVRGLLGPTMTSAGIWAHIAHLVEWQQRRGLGRDDRSAPPSAGSAGLAGDSGPMVSGASLLLIVTDAIRLAREELCAEPVLCLTLPDALAPAEARHVARLLQDVRDLFLRAPAHWVVCGTPESEQAVLRASPQVRGVFPTAIQLAPLPADDVVELLRRRYAALQQGMAPYIPPVDPVVAAQLAQLYRGDLRNFLRLLQDAVLRGAGPLGASPVTLAQILGIMGREHAEAIAQDLGATSWGYFRQTVLGTSPEDTLWPRFTQAEAARRCGIAAPGYKRYMDGWLERGYIVPDHTEGRSEWVRLSGEAAIAFAALAADGGSALATLLPPSHDTADLTGAGFLLPGTTP